MKKTAGLVGSIVLSIFSTISFAQTWEAKNNPTVDSITAKYKDKVVAVKPAPSMQDIFPALGKYTLATAEAQQITISPDAQNKGIVWIEGLPQGRIKALLKKSPATYKIPVQKNEEDKDIAEGAMFFNKEENKLYIILGRVLDEVNPLATFVEEEPEPGPIVKETSKKLKKEPLIKTWKYTGTKIVIETAVN
jgi:hypothetical protein